MKIFQKTLSLKETNPNRSALPSRPVGRLAKKSRKKMSKQAEKKNDAPRRPTPEEYRAVRRRVQRETVRAVKRTLIAIAIVAGLYYLCLTAADRSETPRPPAAENDVAETPPTP